MPLNGEELLRQKKFERDQYARPTKEQLEHIVNKLKYKKVADL